MRIISCLALVVTFLLSMTSVGCAHYSAGPWTGKVIDSETKQPIEGAVVVAEWYESFAAIPETSSRFRGSKEVLTDSEGMFKIDAQSFFSMLPDSRMPGPDITIFKAGYGYFPVQHIYPKDWNRHYFEKPGAVVELPKYKTMEERRQKLQGGLIPGLHDFSKLKKFMEQVNIERVGQGYKPLKPK